jgi:hypothetical protein
MTAVRRKLNDTEEYGILTLWRIGLDTFEIASELSVHESVVANRLMRLREEARRG